MRQFFSTFLAGEATIKQSFFSLLALLAIWGLLSLLLIDLLAHIVSISHYVLAVNGAVFLWGGLAIWGASITSHAISQSFHSLLAKFFLRFLNFILLFAGIVMIILVTSGELSWLTYLTKGVNSAIH